MKPALITTVFSLLLAAFSLAEESTAKPDVSITVTGNDTMQFDQKALEVTEGQVVEITFKNIGKLPKEAMGHNLVVLKSGEDLMQFALAASKPENKPDDYLPDSLKDKTIAYTKLLGPGEEDTITFTAPAAGKYEYLCTFPGHFAVMRGVLTVKAKE